MIKIFNENDTDFSSNGNIVINPIKCLETHKKSLNGWYIDVEISTKYKDYISNGKIIAIKSKGLTRPQGFRIKNFNIENNIIRLSANHVVFDSENYFLEDVRPENKTGAGAITYINERTDKKSPFIVSSNIETVNTCYFIRSSLLEAWSVLEERYNGVFYIDNWDIKLLNKVGNDNGLVIRFGQNIQGIQIYEDWSNVCTKLYPVGFNGLLLPEKFIESDIQYKIPYTKTVSFNTDIETGEQTDEKMIQELREKAKEYLNINKYPQVSYELTSNINQELNICDTVHVKHPLVDLETEVIEFTYNTNTELVEQLTFGNFVRDVKTKFSDYKESVKNAENVFNNQLSKQEQIIKDQTELINNIGKNGYIFFDENEFLIMDSSKKETAKNIWRWNLGGLGHSKNGYEGPFDTAITMDGKINANYIMAGILQGIQIIANEGNIAGFDLSKNGFVKEYDIEYQYTLEDVALLCAYIDSNWSIHIELSEALQKLLDGSGDGSLDVRDIVFMINNINGKVDSNKNIKGKIEINPNNPNSLIKLTNNIEIEPSRLGIYSLFFYLLRCNIFICGETNNNGVFKGIIIDSKQKQIIVCDDSNSGNTGEKYSTIISPGCMELFNKQPYIDFKDLAGNDYDVRIIFDGTDLQFMMPSYSNGKFRFNKEVIASRFTIANEGPVVNSMNGHLVRTEWTGSQLQFWVDSTMVGTVSDKRLKTDITDIDQDFINIIKEIEMKQFKVSNRNGLVSFGIIAQDLIEIFEKYGKNPFDYEIVYKTKYRTDDNTIYYGINYEQFLILKTKAQEIKIKELEKKVEDNNQRLSFLMEKLNFEEEYKNLGKE